MIFDGDLRVVAEAARRWRAREAQRMGREGKSVADVETPQRIEARLKRLTAAATAPSRVLKAGPPLPEAQVLRAIGLERTIGRSDFQGIAFLELALAVSRFVGRVSIRSAPSRGVGFGTGFMVSPRLLLTNNHVLPTPGSAQFSEVEFDYQNDRAGRPLPLVPFALEPQIFFMTDVELDFSLVAVAEGSRQDTPAPLAQYGWSRLIAEEGKILIGEHVNIIQHPKGQYKQFVSRANELVDILESHLHYITDTEQGSSGSPVYNDQWEVVALHHSGVPRMENGQYMAKDGRPWDGRDSDEIDWIANEGVRASRIVRHIEARSLDRDAARLRDDLLNREPPSPLEAAQMAAHAADQPNGRSKLVSIAAPAQAEAAARLGGTSFTIPLHITVELGAPESPPAAIAGPEEPATDRARAPAEAPRATGTGSPELVRALAELEDAQKRPYYDAQADDRARNLYYRDLDGNAEPAVLFKALHALLRRTHKTELRYKPALQVYPWVDLRPGSPPSIRSIYSNKGFEPRELIEADFRLDTERERLRETLKREGATALESALDLLEASLPYNCEHVVPQSWFAKREPMRGDLHHLFACESRCNSFRSNTPYFDFPEFQEAIRSECGKSEAQGFEPFAGKGAVARATLYFLLRYPGEIDDSAKEYSKSDLATLLDWHRRHPVDEYERHRNAAIFEKQGNRNPLIDHPGWAERIDFAAGLGRRGQEVAGARPSGGEPEGLDQAVRAIAALDARTPSAAALTEAAADFGAYEGLPPEVALLDEGRTVKLLKPLTYVSEIGERWPVEAGVVVDGASIPRAFWSLIGGPFEGRYRNASIIHDRFCDLRSRSWEVTHRMFHDAMRCSGVPLLKAKVMFYAVYRFGPRWTVGQEATGSVLTFERRAPTDADALSLLEDARTIYAENPSLQEIEAMAVARG
ncbi:endonuclease [Microvirga arabica]|uniref:Endonuclease n=1 Tax=Microvirga arabica TaxID=1128671 RepID=A0ABV6Y2Y7_9HYPH